jgi:uncharacterized OB-fold protein
MSEPVTSIESPVRLDYTYAAGRASRRFLEGIVNRRILGQRCSSCKRVYVPARGSCPRCAVPTDESVEVSHKGTVTTFCIVRIPSENLSVDPPFACAHVLLDGADIPMMHVLSGGPLEDVRMGMRVKAHWVPDEELGRTLLSIQYFEPIDEPDTPFERYKEHL